MADQRRSLWQSLVSAKGPLSMPSRTETAAVPPLVMVEWEDSAQPVAQWSYLADWETGQAVRCTSVGWLIDDGEVKALAANVAEFSDTGRAQISGVMRIPARAVVRIVRLSEQN